MIGLAAAFPELTPMEPLSNGVFTNTKDESYASAMLVLPELWAPLSKKVKAPMLVAVPARSTMFVMSGKDSAVVSAMQKIVAGALETEDYALSCSSGRRRVFASGRRRSLSLS